MNEYLSEELLGEIEQKIFKMRIGEAAATCFHPDLVERLITNLRNERAEHQRTREKLEAAWNELDSYADAQCGCCDLIGRES